MIIYNVTVKIDNSVHDKWLDWMRSVHIKDVMNTGYFIENRILKILGDDDPDATSYAIQYTCNNMEAFEKYSEIFAPALRAEHSEKFKDKFVSFRTLLEVV